MYLSVIIPAYNEEGRLEKALSKIALFLNSRGYDYEIIVVDDGSSDRTPNAAEGILSQYAKNWQVLRNSTNRGKGHSARKGILASKGDTVLFTDADLSTPIEELDKLSGCIRDGYDVAIGSRALKDSQVRVHQPWYRENMGKAFNFLVKLFVINDFNDTQCGFKLFKGDAARDLAKSVRIDGFSFDVEVLYLARAKGYKVKEVGVIWDNSPQSKVKAIGSSIAMFRDLLKIKRLHR